MAQGNGALGNGGTVTHDGLGEVSWSVVETMTGKELGSGQLSVTSEDVVLEKHLTAENIVYYRKKIRLCDPFVVSLDEHPGRTQSDVKGFGLTAGKDDVQTFSWEWFNVTAPTEAIKLQEEGNLAIEVGQVAGGWEVVRTEFLTDVSLRITRFFGDPSQEPFWRVTIRKGSWVNWPPSG